MKICMFVSNDLINDPRVTRHAESLGKSGHSVLVICTKSNRTAYVEKREFYSVRRSEQTCYKRLEKIVSSRSRKRRVPREESSSVSPSSTKRFITSLYGSLAYLFFFFDMTWRFFKLGREFNAHVYVSNDLDTLLAGVLCARASRKLIHDAHEMFSDQFVGLDVFPSFMIAWFRIMESVLLKRADAVITVNEFISAELQRRYHIREPRVILNVPKMGRQIEPILRTHEIKTALYQGIYARHRGLENLIRACEFLSKDVTLVLRGYGPNESELRQIAKQFGNCRLDKPVPPSQLVLAASSADIGIIPYLPINLGYYFASPNKLFEYIQAGLPVVGSDLPFIRKIVVENKIGYLYDPQNPRDIANAINIATRDENLRVLKSNVQRIRNRYSWDEEEKKLIKIFDNC